MDDAHAQSVSKVGESIDKLVSIEITGRGIVERLYRAAREKQGEPLCLLAARRLAEVVKLRDVVVICTGLPTYPWFSGEQDGPVGAATLARALVLAFGAKPVIVTDPVNADICRAALRGAGLYASGLEQAMRLPTTAAVIAFPIDPDEAAQAGRRLIADLNPKAFVTIERPGANEKGHYHSAGGRNFTDHCAKLDLMLEEARRMGILTIGIGDGGNEIGCAMIRDTVIEYVPKANPCHCPCGGSVVPAAQTDVFVMAAISNWGAYGIEANLATLVKRPDVLHDREIDARVHRLCADAGANNNGPGLLDVGTDAVPYPIHGALLDVMGFVVQSGADPGRLYKNPRYPWLYYPER